RGPYDPPRPIAPGVARHSNPPALRDRSWLVRGSRRCSAVSVFSSFCTCVRLILSCRTIGDDWKTGSCSHVARPEAKAVLLAVFDAGGSVDAAAIRRLTADLT